MYLVRQHVIYWLSNETQHETHHTRPANDLKPKTHSADAPNHVLAKYMPDALDFVTHSPDIGVPIDALFAMCNGGCIMDGARTQQASQSGCKERGRACGTWTRHVTQGSVGGCRAE